MANKQPGGATGSQTTTRCKVRAKRENYGHFSGGRSYRFTVKFSPDEDKYPVSCETPCTVLEGIKSRDRYEQLKWSDDKIVIQIGKGDKNMMIATHFPCSCIKEGATLIISCQSEKVEEAQQYRTVQTRDKYSVFYIDTVGGLYTKQKKLFRNNAVKDFKFLCVYGENELTVEEALKRDGRFTDFPDGFKLSDNDDPTSKVQNTDKVKDLNGKKFKICLPRKSRSNAHVAQQSGTTASNAVPGRARGARTSGRHSDGGPGAAGQQGGGSDSALGQQGGGSVSALGQQGGGSVSALGQQGGGSVSAAGQQGGGSVSAAGQQGGSTLVKIISDYAHCQFPHLIEWTKNQFPGDSYQRALDLKKEDFGKIQSSFSKFKTFRKLLELGESVCLLHIVCCGVESQGTGFVLFDNFILTNAHLFNEFFALKTDNWKQHAQVSTWFHYEDSDCNWISFNAKDAVVFTQGELDYAVLELSCNTQTQNVPPGLLKMFGPVPLNGEGCIIGHPAGGEKEMDPICIIEKENREQAVSHLHQNKDKHFVVCSTRQRNKEQSIENIITGKKINAEIVTYNTFMYHGSSGSPVFDAHTRVFGLHTAGYTCRFENHKVNVIEFAQPLLTIFKDFVRKLKEGGEEGLLMRVAEEVRGNPFLERVFETVVGLKVVKTEPTDTEELIDSVEPMDTV